MRFPLLPKYHHLLAPACVLCSSLSKSIFFSAWVGDLISMASNGLHIPIHTNPSTHRLSVLATRFSQLDSRNLQFFRRLIARLCRSLQSLCDGYASVDEGPSVSDDPSCRLFTLLLGCHSCYSALPLGQVTRSCSTHAA
jgi:hypothetical protein